ncbi:MAG TPA: hypothetical protein PK510_13305 [Ottowia sp.]|nr:hypothetical protein [Ottowia sp.]HPK33395.1 hypothetical protein [Ottowia sp.]
MTPADGTPAPTPSEMLSGADGKVRLYGILELKPSLVCHEDLLGATFAIAVNGIAGNLHIPGSPSKLDALADHLNVPLVPPSDAATWQHRGDPIPWGVRYAVRYPDGHPEVRRVLLTFDVRAEQFQEASIELRNDFNRWLAHLKEVLDLLSKRCLIGPTYHVWDPAPKDLDLFAWGPDGKQKRARGVNVSHVTALSEVPDAVPRHEHFRVACALASSGTPLPSPYQFQLAAYRAFEANDYRKAVVETAVAAEIALTNTIKRRLSSDGLAYAQSIMKKFRMLSGRIELAQAMTLPLPTNLKDTLVEPRNRVAHQGYEPTIEESRNAICATDEILIAQLPLAPSHSG